MWMSPEQVLNKRASAQTTVTSPSGGRFTSSLAYNNVIIPHFNCKYNVTESMVPVMQCDLVYLLKHRTKCSFEVLFLDMIHHPSKGEVEYCTFYSTTNIQNL